MPGRRRQQRFAPATFAPPPAGPEAGREVHRGPRSLDPRLGNGGLQSSLGLGGGSRGGDGGPDASWIDELLGVAPASDTAEGPWGRVQEEAVRLAQRDGDDQTAVAADDRDSRELGITDRGRADLDRLAAAASRPWYSRPRGKCYAAVAGYSPEAYVNRAGGRWKQLADRIPGSHTMWAVSFAHWLQETAHGRRAAAELGFEIVESDGRTRLGDYLAARPELKGAVVVVPHGQQGTASREWNAAANYGDSKWGAGVGDISVVTEITERGATHVADAVNPHDEATMWWVVYPK